MRVHPVPLAALVAATFAVPSISQGAGGSPYRYTATELRPFTTGVTGQGSGVAQMINNRGVTCGMRVDEPSRLAWCYDAGQVLDLLPLPGASDSVAGGINDRGQVAGMSGYHAAVWYKGTPEQLPINASYSIASAINNAGHVVGSYYRGAFLWKDGTLENLGDLSPVAINNKDQVAGLTQVPDPLGLSISVDRAVLHEGGVTRELGTLGGRNSRANDINDRGQVVGTSDVSPAEGSPRHAFLYDENGMHDLGGGPNGASTGAWGINNLGQVVGAMEEVPDPSAPPAFNGRAFLWERDTGYQDLNDMIEPGEGWKIVYATSINDQQEIVGFGCKNDLCGPVLLKRCDGADRTSQSGSAPQAEEPTDRRNNNGAGEHGGSVLAVPL